SGSVSRQLPHCRVEFFSLHDRQDSLHQIQLQEILATNEEVVFSGQSNEIEVELACCSLDAKTYVSHVARDVGGDRQVREFHLFVSRDSGAVDIVLLEDLVEEEPRTGLGIPIYESHSGIEEVSD